MNHYNNSQRYLEPSHKTNGNNSILPPIKSYKSTKSSYVSDSLKKFFAEGYPIEDPSSSFKPFRNERDSLNRLIDCPRVIPLKKEVTLSQVLKNINKLQKYHDSPHVYISFDKENPVSFKHIFTLFKKRNYPPVRSKKQISPLIKLPPNIETVLP